MVSKVTSYSRGGFLPLSSSWTIVEVLCEEKVN